MMDADQYVASVPIISMLLEDLSYDEKLLKASHVAIATHVPIIAVFAWIGELYGFSDQLNKKLTILMEFYNIKEVKVKGRIL